MSEALSGWRRRIRADAKIASASPTYPRGIEEREFVLKRFNVRLQIVAISLVGALGLVTLAGMFVYNSDRLVDRLGDVDYALVLEIEEGTITNLVQQARDFQRRFSESGSSADLESFSGHIEVALTKLRGDAATVLNPELAEIFRRLTKLGVEYQNSVRAFGDLRRGWSEQAIEEELRAIGAEAERAFNIALGTPPQVTDRHAGVLFDFPLNLLRIRRGNDQYALRAVDFDRLIAAIDEQSQGSAARNDAIRVLSEAKTRYAELYARSLSIEDSWHAAERDYAALSGGLGELRFTLRRIADQGVARASTVQKDYKVLVFSSTLVILVLIGGFTLAIGRNMTARLAAIIGTLNQLVQGKKDVRIPLADDRTEFGTIARFLSQYREKSDSLRQSEHRLSEAQRIGHIGSWEYSALEDVFQLSADSARLIGCGETECSLSRAEFEKFVAFEDRDILNHALSEALHGTSRFSIDYRVVQGDGNKRWIHAEGENAIVDGYQPPLTITGMIQDITNRKEAEEAHRASEERFRSIFVNAGIGMTITDPAGSFIGVNPAFCKMLGYDEEELVGKKVFDVTHPDDVQDTRIQRQKTLKTGGGEGPREKRYLTKDGETVWGELSRALVHGPDGKLQYVIGQIQDITARKESEEQLRQAQKMEAVGQLTGGIAHDFNNLLAALQGNLELAQIKSDGNQEVEEKIDRAITIVRRGAALTQHLLAFSRKQTLLPRSTDVGELVRNMLSLFERTLSEAIVVKTHIAADIWEAMVDASQLENAILNLAINSRDAMPDGGDLVLDVRNARIAKDHADIAPGDYVAVSITDEGHGISPKNLEKIFDPFFTTKEFGRGSGLGLSMVHGFIKQSGGGITVDSEMGKGTTVTLYLPKSDKASANDNVDEAGGEAEVDPDRRVLVIEDDPEVRQVVLEILGGLGFQTVDGGDGSGIDKVMARLPDPIDLLLTDVVLPNGTSGHDLAKTLVGKHPELKVLMMSGYAEEQILKSTNGELRFPLINKPFEAKELAKKIREIV